MTIKEFRGWATQRGYAFGLTAVLLLVGSVVYCAIVEDGRHQIVAKLDDAPTLDYSRRAFEIRIACVSAATTGHERDRDFRF